MTSTGFLRRSPTGVAGELVDAFGFVSDLVGVPGVRDGVAVYVLTLRLKSVPAAYGFDWDGEEGIAHT
jgi:hypothetical protein